MAEKSANLKIGQTADITTPTPTATEFDPKRWSFILTVFSLAFIGFITTLDVSSISIALPTIAADLNSGNNYVWIANSYVLAQTIVQLPLGQICNIFGRRIPMIISVAIFTIGSGISGGARSTVVLIAGRAIQGVGVGGVNVLVELILCDLVPLRERGQYYAIVLSTSAIGTIAGPVVGGAIAKSNWRWIFYLNIPVGALVLISMIFCLRLQHTKSPSWSHALLRVDWIGGLISMGSICAILIGVLFGGVTYPWSSWHVIFPIVIGFVGWGVFHWYETTKWCKEPSVPPHLFSNRTSCAGFYMTFISAIVLVWASYFWPVYFQGLKGASTTRSGIDMLPFAACLIPVSMVAGVALTKFGVYRPFHFAGFAVGLIGLGLNTTLTQNTPTGAWVVFQMLASVGAGCIFPSLLPAILASLSEADAATATSMFSLMRSFGFVWGITIPSVVFNTSFDRYSSRIMDTGVRQMLANGNAYETVGSDYIKSLSSVSHSQVVSTYVAALKNVWYAAMAFQITGLLIVFVEKHIPLRTNLETEFQLEARKKPKNGSEENIIVEKGS